MSMRYILGNYVNDDTIHTITGGEDPSGDYDKENLFDVDQALPWRMTAKTGSILLDFGANRPTAIGILQQNFSSGATIRLASDAANPPGGGGGWGGGNEDNIEILTWHNMNIWQSFTWDQQYFYLSIADAGNDNNLEIGELVFYTWGAFNMNYKYPFSEGLRRIIGENISHYGRRHRDRKAKQKIFNLEFDAVTDIDLAGQVATFFDTLDAENPFVFIPEHTEEDCFYGYALNDEEAERNFENLNAFNIEFEEQSRGWSML